MSNFLSKILWKGDREEFTGLRRYILTSIQLIEIALQNSWRNQFFLRASALAFTSVLSLVPFLAILFSILKGLGLQNLVGPLILEQLSAGSQDVAVKIIKYINNTNMTSLGGFGVVGLLIAVVMLLDSIEDSFNKIWLVEETRTLRRKLGGYIILIISMPVLIFTALSITTFIESQSVFNWFLTTSHLSEILPYSLFVAPYLLVYAALVFLYMLVPNKKVRLGSALKGAFIAGTLWQVAQWFYVHFQLGVAKNNAIYGTLAALPTFMVWIYVSWLILLFGVEIVHAHQNIKSLTREIRVGDISQKMRELLTLAILQDIATDYYKNRPGWTGERLGDALDLPERILKELLDNLLAEGYIYATTDNPPVYSLSAEPAKIMIGEVLQSLRDSSSTWKPLFLTEGESALAELLDRAEFSSTESLSGISLQDLTAAAPSLESRSTH